MNKYKQIGEMAKDIDILGYQSPIEVIIGQMRLEQENNIFKAIRDCGINVDKDELIKALEYDRAQYEQGYINGYKTKASEVAEEIFAEIEKIIDTYGDEYGTMLVIDEDGLAELKKKYQEDEG